MSAGRLTFVTAIVFLTGATIPVRLAAQNASSGIVTFDAPGSIPHGASFDGTFPTEINAEGTVTGIYIDTNTLFHGFTRSSDGSFTSLDAPGAGTSVGTRFRPRRNGLPTGPNINSRSININDHGTTTGNYIDTNNVSHGFVRNSKGHFIAFDAPGARSEAGSFDGTFPTGINSAGTIAGYFIDSRGRNRGFLRSPSGEFIRFDAPGASRAAAYGYGTFPQSINNSGAITGHLVDASGFDHGFLRSPTGELITFDAPGVSSSAFGTGTYPESINGAGAITGYYSDADGEHGFLRSPDGEFISFDAPGAGIATVPKSINAAGAIAGHFTGAQNVNRGFVRSPDGSFTIFDGPGAVTTGGTFPESINEAGAIAGHYTDSQGLNHGFLRFP